MSSALGAIFMNSLAGSVVFNRSLPQYAPFQSYVANFFALLALQYVAYFIWNVILWPKLFTPLRGLPGPKVCLNRPESAMT
jgi:hypothetical protein